VLEAFAVEKMGAATLKQPPMGDVATKTSVNKGYFAAGNAARQSSGGGGQIR